MLDQLVDISVRVLWECTSDLNQGPKTLWYLGWDAFFFPGEVALRLAVAQSPLFATWVEHAPSHMPGIMAGILAFVAWYLLFWIGMRISRLFGWFGSRFVSS